MNTQSQSPATPRTNSEEPELGDELDIPQDDTGQSAQPAAPAAPHREPTK
jgi:hypothetical protein